MSRQHPPSAVKRGLLLVVFLGLIHDLLAMYWVSLPCTSELEERMKTLIELDKWGCGASYLATRSFGLCTSTNCTPTYFAGLGSCGCLHYRFSDARLADCNNSTVTSSTQSEGLIAIGKHKVVWTIVYIWRAKAPPAYRAGQLHRWYTPGISSEWLILLRGRVSTPRKTVGHILLMTTQFAFIQQPLLLAWEFALVPSYNSGFFGIALLKPSPGLSG
ncbi:hypothetical protein FN846DRAFT_71597 [Sphaerosporella brunnea]|uniref:Uncharacterized protein n=1 Tax=Sphaerosporella brunnea TaxID=1250544 RepID=A0A5J5ETY5_9PEZI|nr:hypothetical protein FN846DRAFT_71597 [Sphaerosporella brunnea]